MDLKDKIKLLIKSDISAYRIAKDTGITQSKISDLRNGNIKIGNLTLDKAEELGDYYDQLKQSKKI